MNFLTVGQAAKRLKVTRQAIHWMIKHEHIRGAVFMLERWAIPEVEVSRLEVERSKQSEAA